MVIDVFGSKTATIQRVESVGKEILLVGRSMRFRLDGSEIRDPGIPGCRSYLVPFDDGEAQRWQLYQQVDEVTL